MSFHDENNNQDDHLAENRGRGGTDLSTMSAPLGVGLASANTMVFGSPLELGGTQETNTVEITGPVMLQDPRRRTEGNQPRANETRGELVRTSVTSTGALTTQLMVQVNEEDGSAYGIRLVFPPRSEAEEQVIAGLEAGDRVRVVGRLAWRDSYDTRYATFDAPMGRSVRELVVIVLFLERADSAAINGSWVKLRGTVRVFPNIRAHETSPADKVARGSLEVEVRQPSRRPNSKAEFVQREAIAVDVPLSVRGAEGARKRGNEIEVEGHLEMYRFQIRPDRPGNEMVGQAVQALKSRLTEGLQGLPEHERRQATRRGTAQLRSMQQETRLRVRADYVELISGEVISIEDTIRLHQEELDTIQQRRGRRAARSNGGTALKAASDVQLSSPVGETPTRHRKQTVPDTTNLVALNASDASIAEEEAPALQLVEDAQ